MSRRRNNRQANEREQAEMTLQQEIEKAEREANEKFAAAEKRARDAAREEREAFLTQLKQWGSTLYLFPLIPAFFAVITICVVAVVNNTDYRQDDGLTCNDGRLNTYLLMCQILAYFFLFGYGCMFIGTRLTCLGWHFDCYCKRIKSVVQFYAVTIVLGVGVNGFGAWVLANSAQCAEAGKTPYAYRVSQMEAAFFWGCGTVALIYFLWYRGKKAREAHLVKKAAQAAADAAWEEEEAERLAHAEAQLAEQEDAGGDWFAENGANSKED